MDPGDVPVMVLCLLQDIFFRSIQQILFLIAIIFCRHTAPSAQPKNKPPARGETTLPSEATTSTSHLQATQLSLAKSRSCANFLLQREHRDAGNPFVATFIHLGLQLNRFIFYQVFAVSIAEVVFCPAFDSILG